MLLFISTLEFDALAQSADRSAEARALFEKGVKAFKEDDLERARTMLLDSLAMIPTPNTSFKLGLVEEKLGLVASALKHYRQAAQLLSDQNKDDRRLAEEHASAVEVRVPTIRVTLSNDTPAGARMLLDAEELSASEFGKELSLNPGQHQLTLFAPGRVASTHVFVLKESQHRQFTLQPGRPEVQPPVPSTTTTTSSLWLNPTTVPPGVSKDDAIRPGSDSWKIAGFSVGAIGLVGAIVGGVAGGLALGKRSELDVLCPVPANCSVKGERIAQDGAQLATVSTIGLASGVPLAAVGTAFLLVGLGTRASKVTAAATVRSVGVTVEYDF